MKLIVYFMVAVGFFLGGCSKNSMDMNEDIQKSEKTEDIAKEAEKTEEIQQVEKTGEIAKTEETEKIEEEKPQEAKDEFVFSELSQAKLKKYNWSEIEGWSGDDFNESFEVFKTSCEKKLKNSSLFKDSCENAKNIQDAKSFFESNFEPFKLHTQDGSDKGTITGYYEPLLNGSRTKSEIYKYPIYKKPKDMYIIKFDSVYPELKDLKLRGRIVGSSIVPYYTRGEIEKNTDVAEAICYVDDDVDLFFLHIQGSGRVQLDNGEIINVGYSDQNGHRYFSIGKKLIEDGIIQTAQGSLQGMKKWFLDNPDKKESVLNMNSSYIFFTENGYKASGSLGVELTPKRSIAVDTKYIPLGAPVFIHTKNPKTKEEMQRLVFAQDVGGAIKGEIRADFFWGFGKEAEGYAGIMKEKGSLIVLLPKNNEKLSLK